MLIVGRSRLDGDRSAGPVGEERPEPLGAILDRAPSLTRHPGGDPAADRGPHHGIGNPTGLGQLDQLSRRTPSHALNLGATMSNMESNHVRMPSDEVLRLIALEEIDTDLYRASNPSRDEGLPLYGGQVAAQALLAASRTVDDDRFIHSMHGYYLRSGTWSRPILLHVDRDRDGGSYSARHVVARQNGEAIFTMSASFHRERETTDRGHERPPAEPQRYEPPTDSSAIRRRTRPALAATIDLVPIEEPGEAPIEHATHFWVRSRAALPDDRRAHEAVLMYVSDLSTGWAREFDLHAIGGPSLDHAVWFHEPGRLDDWVRIKLEPLVFRLGRALYSGTVYDRDGTVLASLIQQHIFRPTGDRPRR